MERNSVSYRGCLLGLAVGDAMGYTVDGKSWDQIRQNYGPNGLLGYDLANGCAEVSSYTQIASYVANGLLIGITRGHKEHYMRFVRQSMREWARSQMFYRDPEAALCWVSKLPAFRRRNLMDSRMLGFMMHKFHIQGILYFNILHGWNNPRLVRINPAFTYSNGRVLHGLGHMIYPPEEKNGKPLSSLRFVMCRDAYEDYEYFLIAEKLIKKCKDPAKAAAGAKLIKEACDAIVPAYEAYADRTQWKKTKWETDGAKLLVWRAKIADLIESLQK